MFKLFIMDTVKCVHQGWIMRCVWNITVKNYLVKRGRNFLPTVWKIMYLVLFTFTDILLDMNQEAPFFQFIVNPIYKFRQIFSTSQASGIISKKVG